MCDINYVLTSMSLFVFKHYLMTNTLRHPATALLFMFVTALDAIGRGGFRALAVDVLEIQSDE